MTVDKESLFELLDPPPGGLDRMRRRLEERIASPAPPRRRLAAGAIGIVAVAFALSLLVRDGSERGGEPERRANLYDAREFDRLLGRRPEAVELRVAINDKSPVVSEVESSRPKVRIYELELSEP